MVKKFLPTVPISDTGTTENMGQKLLVKLPITYRYRFLPPPLQFLDAASVSSADQDARR
jgi:hypothetical protein